MAQKTIVVLLLLLSSITEACDWSTIKKVDGGYLYSKSCHIEVGRSLNELDLRSEQVIELEKALLAQKEVVKAEVERGDLWYSEAKKLENHIKAEEASAPYKKALYFILGAGVMYGASRISN